VHTNRKILTPLALIWMSEERKKWTRERQKGNKKGKSKLFVYHNFFLLGTRKATFHITKIRNVLNGKGCKYHNQERIKIKSNSSVGWLWVQRECKGYTDRRTARNGGRLPWHIGNGIWKKLLYFCSSSNSGADCDVALRTYIIVLIHFSRNKRGK
jgi:hypothetical protein